MAHFYRAFDCHFSIAALLTGVTGQSTGQLHGLAIFSWAQLELHAVESARGEEELAWLEFVLDIGAGLVGERKALVIDLDDLG